MNLEDWKYSQFNRVQTYLAEACPQLIDQEAKATKFVREKSPSLEFQSIKVDPSDLIQKLKTQGNIVFFSNGQWDRDKSFLEGLQVAEVKVSEPCESHPIIEFNSKKTNQKIQLHLSNNTKDPIFVIYYVNNQSQSYQFDVIVDSGSHEVCEIFLQPTDAKAFISVRTDIKLGPNTQLRHSLLAHLQSLSRLSHFLDVEQMENSHSKFFNLSLVGEWMRFDLRNRLKQKGAQTQVGGLYLKGQNDFVDHCTKIFHQAPQTQSEQIYKGVLGGTSRGIFNGLIQIEPRCPDSQANQLNKNLVLSSKATVVSRPQLKVLTDNVKANHGMTIGNLNPEEIFYLMSRGIPKERAYEVLADAFVNELIERFVGRHLQNYVNNLLGGAWQPLRKLSYELQ